MTDLLSRSSNLAGLVSASTRMLITQSSNGPGLIVDQRRMLARVALILVRNLPDINRVSRAVCR